MTTIIKEQIKKYFPEYKNRDIQFLKFSTAGSGMGKYNKVIFLAFVGGDAYPFCCVKTVRTYAESLVISDGFDNLKLLNKLTAVSAFEDMFPKAIWLYDDKKEFIFSIESVCSGNKVSISGINIDFILDEYFGFQKHISTSSKRNVLISEYFKNLLEKINLSDSDTQEISSYFFKLWKSAGNEIYLVPQHGDFTLDNIFINGKNICIIDCDLFGYVELAGFDLFHFLLRYKRSDFAENLEKYFLKYRQYINEENLHFGKDLIFLYYLNVLLIKGNGTVGFNAKDIIINFNKLFSYGK